MFERIWKHLSRATLGSCTALLLVAGSVQADDAAKDREIQELKARQEQQAKEIEALKIMIQGQQTSISTSARPAAKATVEEIVDDYLKAKEADKKADDDKRKQEAREKGIEVGSDLRMSATWNSGVWVETENKDFRLHIGSWVQADNWSFKQPNNLRGAPPGGNLGIPGSSGVGVLDDGDFFRRARLLMEGTCYENFEFKANYCFENVSTVVFDEVWMGIRDLPFLGTVCFGHIKVPQGLESYSSTRYIPMIERSALLDTFWDEFATGILVTNSILDQRMTWAVALHRNEAEFTQDGAQFGDGTYAVTGRVTALPLYENDGRCLLHLGLSAKYQTGDVDRTSGFPGSPSPGNGIAPLPPGALPPGVNTTDLLRFRSRPDFRDFINVPVGAGNATFGDNGRFLDTGNIISDHVCIMGSELLFYWNRLNVQAEATWAHTDNAFYPYPPGGAAPLTPPFQRVGSLDFWGAYCQVGYFIVNGRRTYDRRYGRYDRVYPEENFFLVRDEEGGYHAGTGAVELLYRYTFVDLNDKIVQGGNMTEHTVGLNWYLNPNMRLQCNYVYAERSVLAPAFSGAVQALGFQAAYDF